MLLGSFVLLAAFSPALFWQARPPAMETLLRKAGFQVSLDSHRTARSREFRIRWLSTGSLHLLDSRERNDPPPRQRSSEISPDQLVVIATDQRGAVRYWQIITDPRLLRGEFPDAQSNLKKRIFYQADSDLSVSLPSTIDAAEIRILTPSWDAAGQLKLSPLTALRLTSGARQ